MKARCDCTIKLPDGSFHSTGDIVEVDALLPNMTAVFEKKQPERVVDDIYYPDEAVNVDEPEAEPVPEKPKQKGRPKGKQK